MAESAERSRGRRVSTSDVRCRLSARYTVRRRCSMKTAVGQNGQPECDSPELPTNGVHEAMGLWRAVVYAVCNDWPSEVFIRPTAGVRPAAGGCCMFLGTTRRLSVTQNVARLSVSLPVGNLHSQDRTVTHTKMLKSFIGDNSPRVVRFTPLQTDYRQTTATFFYYSLFFYSFLTASIVQLGMSTVDKR